MTMTGHCLDELQAREYGRDKEADHYHRKCRSPEQCGCPGHRDGEDEQ
jgi:hypothetical protein